MRNSLENNLQISQILFYGLFAVAYIYLKYCISAQCDLSFSKSAEVFLKLFLANTALKFSLFIHVLLQSAP